MVKKQKNNWKKMRVLSILGALTLEPYFFGVLNAQESTLEKDLDITGLRIQNYELRKELEKYKEDLVAVKRSLYLKEVELQNFRKDLALISDELKSKDVNAILLKELDQIKNLIYELKNKQDDLKDFSLKSLKSLNAEQVLIDEYIKKVALLEYELSKALEDINPKAASEQYVLRVNSDLNVLAMSQGYKQGIVPGSNWNVRVDNRKVATIKIIEVRRNVSLALIVSGEVNHIVVGAEIVK